jgi:hypothetical protein
MNIWLHKGTEENKNLRNKLFFIYKQQEENFHENLWMKKNKRFFWGMRRWRIS